MRTMKPILTSLLLGSVVLLAACGGGSSTTSTQSYSRTIGQELMDLKASYDQGIINEAQYEQGKKDILNRYN